MHWERTLCLVVELQYSQGGNLREQMMGQGTTADVMRRRRSYRGGERSFTKERPAAASTTVATQME